MFSGSAKVVAFVSLDSRHPSRPAFGVDDWGAENDGGRGCLCSTGPPPPYLVVLAVLVCVQAFYANHLFDSSIRRGQALL